MQNLAKQTSREMFYEFVKSNLTKEDLNKINVVVLMGEHKQELPLIKHVGIKPNNVVNIERDRTVYNKLHLWNRSLDYKNRISLWQGALRDYLQLLDFKEQKFGIFHMDTYGTLSNEFDGDLSHIFNFGQGQSKAIIGMYSTGGRDKHVLLKAIQAYCWLNIFDSEISTTAKILINYFKGLGYTEQVATNHMLRVMLCVYELVQSLIKSSNPRLVKGVNLDQIPSKFWEQCFKGTRSLTLEVVSTVANEFKSVIPKRVRDLKLGYTISEMQFSCYRSGHWTRFGFYFSVEGSVQNDLSSTLKFLVKKLTDLAYIDCTDGSQLILSKDQIVLGRGNPTIWHHSKYRELKSLLPDKTTREKRMSKNKKNRKTPTTKKPEVQSKSGNGKSVQKIRPDAKFFVDGNITTKGKEFIKKQAKNPNSTTASIKVSFPPDTPASSITALLARARRN